MHVRVMYMYTVYVQYCIMYVYKSMYIYAPTLEAALHPLCSWPGYGPAEKKVTEELSHHLPLGESSLNDIISTLHRL